MTKQISSFFIHFHNREVLGALRGGLEALRTAMAGDNSPDAAAATLDDLQQVMVVWVWRGMVYVRGGGFLSGHMIQTLKNVKY